MKSMTGYGRGESTIEGCKITAEASSVNRKQMELNIFLPRELDALESRVREEVNKRVARGRVTIRFAWQVGGGLLSAQGQVNRGLARAYANELRALAKELKIPSEITLDLLVRAPGVLQADGVIADVEAFWPGLQKALEQALAGLVKMREREGNALARDLKARVKTMRAGAATIAKAAPEMVVRYREQLRERIAKADLPLPAEDDERLLKEIVYFADRSDISEELTRLQSHFEQFDHLAQSAEPLGRTLDFLAQEMNREVNTIGSKASDSRIAREVVLLKAELEKFREQVQNVE